jgi:hypothetical protein
MTCKKSRAGSDSCLYAPSPEKAAKDDFDTTQENTNDFEPFSTKKSSSCASTRKLGTFIESSDSEGHTRKKIKQAKKPQVDYYSQETEKTQETRYSVYSPSHGSHSSGYEHHHDHHANGYSSRSSVDHEHSHVIGHQFPVPQELCNFPPNYPSHPVDPIHFFLQNMEPEYPKSRDMSPVISDKSRLQSSRHGSMPSMQGSTESSNTAPKTTWNTNNDEDTSKLISILDENIQNHLRSLSFLFYCGVDVLDDLGYCIPMFRPDSISTSLSNAMFYHATFFSRHPGLFRFKPTIKERQAIAERFSKNIFKDQSLLLYSQFSSNSELCDNVRAILLHCTTHYLLYNFFDANELLGICF